MILSVDSEVGLLLADCPFEYKAVKRIKDTMNMIRLNETNLLLLFEK